jgi:hypothetical protein
VEHDAAGLHAAVVAPAEDAVAGGEDLADRNSALALALAGLFEGSLHELVHRTP